MKASNIKLKTWGEVAALWVNAESMTETVLASAAALIGTGPSHTDWKEHSGNFKAAYKKAKQCSTNGAEQAWSRLLAKLKQSYDFAKPKATGAAAIKKAAQREVKAKERAASIEVIAKEHGNNPVAILKAAVKAKEPEVKAKLEAAAKALEKSQDRAARDTLKDARDRVIALVKACDDTSILAELETVLDDHGVTLAA